MPLNGCMNTGADYGCDPERIYVSGNSAGGHLAAELVSDDWPDRYGLPADVVKGACAISGLYDLEPLLECEPNEKLRLDLESAKRYSPIYHLSRQPTPAIIACGANESAEFRRQTGSYAERCAHRPATPSPTWRSRGTTIFRS